MRVSVRIGEGPQKCLLGSCLSNGLSTVGFRLYASAIQPLMSKKIVGIAQKKLYRHSLEPFFSTLHLHILVE
jgi:hypothetical protein